MPYRIHACIHMNWIPCPASNGTILLFQHHALRTKKSSDVLRHPKQQNTLIYGSIQLYVELVILLQRKSFQPYQPKPRMLFIQTQIGTLRRRRSEWSAASSLHGCKVGFDRMWTHVADVDCRFRSLVNAGLDFNQTFWVCLQVLYRTPIGALPRIDFCLLELGPRMAEKHC